MLLRVLGIILLCAALVGCAAMAKNGNTSGLDQLDRKVSKDFPGLQESLGGLSRLLSTGDSEKPPAIDLAGKVTIPQGEWTNKSGKKFTVGQGGGAFFPKKALSDLEYQIRLNDLYIKKLEKKLGEVAALDLKSQARKEEKKSSSWFNIFSKGE